jgi:ATP-binding cassette subfamily F protein uup
MESREWEQMEEKILAAEEELAARQREIQAPDAVSDPLKLHAAYERVKTAEAEVARLYERWAELEAKLAPASDPQ